MPTPILKASGLVKKYPGLIALDRVDFELRRGEIHALVGQNGAGKSTLIKIISGVTRPDEGTLTVDGTDVQLRSTSDAYALGISPLHQELSLVPGLSVGENIFLGRPYPLRRLGVVDWNALHREAERTLNTLGITHIRGDTPIGNLSPADRTMVALARAIFVGAPILILDEPTASLTHREADRLFDVLRGLRDHGTAIIYVSHRMNELFDISDRMTILRDGRVIKTCETAQLSPVEVVRLMTGTETSELFPPSHDRLGATVLELRNVTTKKLKNVSLSVREGEVLGIAGLTGAGRSALLRTLIGLEKVSNGEILLDGRPVHLRSPKHALKHGIALAPEERRSQGLILRESIRNNTTLPHLRTFARAGFWLSRRLETDATNRMIHQLSIQLRDPRQPIWQLSGGNQQKVVVGKFLTRPLKVLLLDEPTRGIDIGAKRDCYQMIRDITATNTAVVLVSSDLDELIGLSDRIIVLRDGSSVLDVETSESAAEQIATAMVDTATGNDPQSLLTESLGDLS